MVLKNFYLYESVYKLRSKHNLKIDEPILDMHVSEILSSLDEMPDMDELEYGVVDPKFEAQIQCAILQWELKNIYI